MIHLASASRIKTNEKTNQGLKMFPKKPEDFNNFVVMSGSATRKRLEKKDNRAEEKTTIRKCSFNQSSTQLRAPFYKSHQKHALNDERVMTKSCEILFECIKPYKDILVTRRTQMKGATKTTHRILTTDIVYERKATRKVQFFTFSEAFPPELDFPQNQNPSLMETTYEDSNEVQKLHFKLPTITHQSNHSQVEINDQNEAGKTVSSEDFITNAFCEPVYISPKTE